MPVPQLITWSDESVTRESRATIKMHFEITGSDMGKDLSFYIVPWETDHLIVGWDTLTQEKWLDRLTDTLTIQRAQGITAGGSSSDGNESVVNMDGTVV